MIPRQPPSGPFINLLSAPDQVDDGNSGVAATIDWSQGPNQKMLLTGNTVITSTGLVVGESASLTLQLTQDATGSRTAAFVGGDKATGFALSTAAGATDLLDLLWTGHVLLVSIRGKAYS